MSVRGDPPPLHMLRALLMVAEERSFSRAAIEMGITQSAVSQRIAALEDRLGAPLFRRDRGIIELTSEGRAYLDSVKGALFLLDQAQTRLDTCRRTIRISAFPSFARCWLVPRLPLLAESFPEVAISVHASDEKMFVDEGGFDLAFRLRPATDRSGEPVNAEEDELIAVQKPETLGASTQSDPFEGRVLLDDDCSRLGIEPGEHWVGWYRQNGYNRVTPRPEMTFNDASLMIEAATAGAGVALARTLLVSESLASGRLITRGSGLRVNSRTMLIQRPINRRSKVAQQVARWFLDAAGAV